MKPLPKFDKRAALTEAEESKTWWCSDCGLPTDEGQTCCESCLQYWADVANGLFDHYEEWKYEREQEHEDFEREEREEINYIGYEREFAVYDEIDDWYYVEH